MKSADSKIRFIRSVFGSSRVSSDGKNIAVMCPGCGTKNSKKKFSINLKTWQCHCWVCGIKGKTLSFILKKYVGSHEANYFAENFLDNSAIDKDFQLDEIAEKVKLPNNFLFLGDHTASNDPDIRACIRYLYRRGLSCRDLWYFKFGTTTIGRHRRRIIMPSFDNDGELNYFSSRKIDSDTVELKYINAKADKLSIIFNEINIDWAKELTIVEGPFDLVKCNSNSTCLLGSQLSERSLLFKKIVANRTPILLSLDSDMKNKAYAFARTLESYCCDVRILDLGKSHDVGEMTRSEFKSARNRATRWNITESLRQKVSELQSGSIF